LTLKNGTRYIGRIQAMSAKTITFQLRDFPTTEPLVLRRRDVKIISSYNQSTSNGNVLRAPFSKITKTFPNIVFDPKLDVKNRSQQVSIISRGKTFIGRIQQVRKSGIQMWINGELKFFRFTNLSAVRVENWSYADIPSPEYTFQVDSFETSSIEEATRFDLAFDLESTKQTHVIYTRDGSRLNGQVFRFSNDQMYLKMKDGSILELEDKMVKKVEVHRPGFIRKEKSNRVIYKKDRRKYFENTDYIMAQNRLLVSQTGFGLKKGETEFRSTQVFFNSLDYGATDNLSFGVGVYPLIGDNVLTGRINFSVDLNKFVHLSSGAQIYYTLGGFATTGGEGAYNAHIALSMGSPQGFINIAYNHWEGLARFQKGDIWSFGFSLKLNKNYRVFADVLYTLEKNNNDFSFFRNNVHYQETIISSGVGWFKANRKIDFGFTFIPGGGMSSIDNFFIFPFIASTRRF
jgi:hypothetical protein